MEAKLKEIGLNDDQIAKAKSILKEEISGKFIPKERFDEINNTLKETKSSLEKFSKLDVDALQKANQELTEKLKEKETAFAKKERDLVIENALKETKARNIKALKGLIDFDKVTYNEGKIEGLTEQITSLKETDAYLFGDEEPTFGKNAKIDTPAPKLSGVEEAFARLNPNIKL